MLKLIKKSHKFAFKAPAKRKPAGAGQSLGKLEDIFPAGAEVVGPVPTVLTVEAVGQLAQALGLPLKRIKQVARISEGSYARRKKTGVLSRDETERVLRIARTYQLAVGLYAGDKEGAREWLETPRPVLGDIRPLDLAQTETGARAVEDLIDRIENGVIS